MAIIHNAVVSLCCFPDCPCFPVGTNEWNADHTIENCTITNAMLAGGACGPFVATIGDTMTGNLTLAGVTSQQVKFRSGGNDWIGFCNL